MATYRLRFWYWYQEVVINGITADELVLSLYFPDSCDMKDFNRIAYLDGINGTYPIEITIHDSEHIYICHLKKDNLEAVDTLFGDKEGRSILDGNYWILEEES